jgi:hypothetical protein
LTPIADALTEARNKLSSERTTANPDGTRKWGYVRVGDQNDHNSEDRAAPRLETRIALYAGNVKIL